ncbi:hypothetical protein F6X40_27400 [Paraburkholderia sp. UCT31]|uniref:hypothetical protein n=1 Tax=Paraburkholderia sp. UCT31 TaxID=2615209 RepID=UPI00165513C9|nr:hypothetical protein [Paraburkholderia sp. UCT31]MBC8740387.1 hypothetical protein [Paraburkholderia sp. UCT31]
MFSPIRRKQSSAQGELERLNQQYEKLKEEHALLAKAVALMGFNPTAVVEQLRPGGDPFWQTLPFLMATVVFDLEKASKLGLSERGIAHGIEAFDSIRLPGRLVR